MRDTVVEEACSKEANWDEVTSKTRKKCVSNTASDLWFAARALGRVVRGSCEQRRLACTKRGCRGRKDADGVRRGWQGRESREAGVHCDREQGRAAGEALDLHKWRAGASRRLGRAGPTTT